MSGIIPPEAAAPAASPDTKHAAGVVRLRRSVLLARFLQSLSGICRYCGQQTGLLQRDHPECRQTHQTGFTEMVRSPPRPPVPTPSTRPHYGSWLGASPPLSAASCIDQLPAQPRSRRFALDMGHREGQNKPAETPDHLPDRNPGLPRPWSASGPRSLPTRTTMESHRIHRGNARRRYLHPA